MKNALIAAASLAAIAAAVPAAAQAQDAATTNAGAYVNLNLGIGSYGSADVKVIQGRAGYRFNDWIGVEGELATGLDSDKDTISGVRVKQTLKHEAAAYLVGFAPIAANTDLIARVGYGTTKAKVSAAGVSASDSNESFNYGVGAQHRFDGVNGVRADFTRQEFNNGGGHANVWTVGYTRKF
ncbi:MAG: porin family protein [Phenylobacterium sp.]|uniref:porin family protein n=1 Tax=Phenylobacterium sp. TaxID=1871053 RepID=UPI001A5F5502|nr:porin family protein [Phenylobacterium sp.]MBL8553452.1 porin family protein [Phenylobacterium sp.]